MNGLNIFLIFFTALAFSLAFVPFLIRIANAKSLYDMPDSSRHIHTKPIPRLGGIAIVFSYFISLFIWKLPSSMLVIFTCSFILFLVGLIDDLKPLSAKIRLIIQFCVAMITVLSEQLNTQNIYISHYFNFQLPYVAGVFFSVFIIIGAINSINMIDGLDGLAGGVVLIGVSLLSYIHFLTTHDVRLLIVFSLPLIASILGFLKYNTHPSSIFMGDGGSNWLGFMIGVLILLVANKFLLVEQNGVWVLTNSLPYVTSQTTPFLCIIMCVCIPVFDTAYVILLRLREGKNPMSADKRHFHHSLIKIGFTHSQSVVTVYFLMILFGILGVLPLAYPQYHLGFAPLLGLLLLTISIVFTQRLNEGFIDKMRAYKFFYSQKKIGFKISVTLTYWEKLNRYTIYVILLATPIFAGVVTRPLGVTAAVMCFILIISLFFQKKFTFFESFVIVIAATILLTANNSNLIWVQLLGHAYSLQKMYNFLFIWLIVSTFFFFIATFKRMYLFIVPTDFLLVILPLLLLLLPYELQQTYKLNIIALRSLVLFAAIRTLGKRHKGFFYRIHFVSIIALAWVALTSLLGLRVVY